MVESERSQKEYQLGIRKVELDPSKPQECLGRLHEHTVDFAQLKILYYSDEAEKHRRYWKRIRLASILLLTAGALCPVLDQTTLFFPEDRVASWGYVFLILAGGILSFERYYGLSARQTRCTANWVGLRKVYAEFLHDWAITKDDKERFERLKKFRLEIESVIAREVEVLATEETKHREELLGQAQLNSPRGR